MTTRIEVITRYADEDPQCLSDYCEVQVWVNGEQRACYGDAYHEKGRERAQGFVDGVLAVLGPDSVSVEQLRRADFPL